MPLLIALVPLILQLEPEVAALIHDLWASGSTAPTEEQLASLTAGRNARLAAQQQFERDAGLTPSAG